jgi:hypothetical protein
MTPKNCLWGLLALGLVGVLPVATIHARSLTPVAEAEIRHLLDYLSSSGCAFYRNGTWYPADRARAHLERKYDYLRERRLIGSAEDFIARAATQSSLSGEAYRVRCDTKVVPSAAWLSAELTRLRERRSSSP